MRRLMAAIRENDERNVEDAVLKLASTRSIFARRQEQVSGINAVQQRRRVLSFGDRSAHVRGQFPHQDGGVKHELDQPRRLLPGVVRVRGQAPPPGCTARGAAAAARGGWSGYGLAGRRCGGLLSRDPAAGEQRDQGDDGEHRQG